MKLSIALCTYNGEKYLPEQLKSYVKQTRRPDQLIVCDDQSTDNTIPVLEAFARTAPFEVRIHRNEQQLGVAGNFSRVVQLCDGDIIFFSDQDDVWMPTKLARIATVFEQHPEVGAVFTDAEVVDQNLRPRPYSLWEAIKFTPELQQQFLRDKARDILVRRTCATGATLAFRAKYVKVITPIPKQFSNDEWTVLLLTLLDNSVSFLPDRLIKYRQHSHNTIGLEWALRQETLSTVSSRLVKATFKGRTSTRYRTFSSLVTRFQMIRDRLLQQDLVPRPNESLSLLDDIIAHYRQRAEMPSNRLYRFPQVVAEFLNFRYFRYANGTRSFIRDIVEKDGPSYIHS